MMGHPRGVLEQEVRKARSARLTLERLARYFGRYWWALLVALLLLGLNAWVQVLTPQWIGEAVDCYLTPLAADQLEIKFPGTAAPEQAAPSHCTFGVLSENATTADQIAGLTRLVLALCGLFAAGALTAGAMFFLMGWTGQRVLRHLQVEVFNHLHRLSLGFYSRNESGDLMSRITNDTSTIQQAMSFALIQVLSGAVILLWIGYKMLILNFVYGLFSLLVVPVMIVATTWFSEQARRAFRKTRKEIGNVNAELQESISSVREVQAFSREGTNIEAFRQSNAANRDANITAVAYTAALSPVLEALGYVAIAIVVGVGGIYLLRGQMLGGEAVTLGMIITYLGYVQRFNQPIQQISVLWANIQSAIAGAERIFDLLDESPDVQERANAREMPLIQGHVRFEKVNAEYKRGEPVLHEIDLAVEPGQTIALVGPTGAGKTTLVNLLPRFYDVTSGSVALDGVDVRDVTLSSLRKQIGVVLQDTFLFSDSVLNNIRFGRPEASDDEVIAAAKLARAHEFIERLPEGYQTKLGERGSGLSQGQRQLISIARAALANPRILILDEATSSVDTRTERQIQSALEQLLAGRTSFVIAHRLSTIRNADCVLVLVKGQIVERGKHEELLEKRSFYYNLYMSQFQNQERMVLATPAITAPSTNGQPMAEKDEARA
jgi:ATP-binding cassette subfamily B protein